MGTFLTPKHTQRNPRHDLEHAVHSIKEPRLGDGERQLPMTRQMPYEPLPASVLLGDGSIMQGEKA
jgi:hypothetical protein